MSCCERSSGHIRLVLVPVGRPLVSARDCGRSVSDADLDVSTRRAGSAMDVAINVVPLYDSAEEWADDR